MTDQQIVETFQQLMHKMLEDSGQKRSKSPIHEYAITKNNYRFKVTMTEDMVRVQMYDIVSSDIYLHVQYDKKQQKFLGDPHEVQFIKSYINQLLLLKHMKVILSD